MQKVAFGITVYNEPPAQLEWCLSHLRGVYPAAPAVVVTDGTTGYAEVCKKHSVDYREGERLKPVANGARWWHRLFTFLNGYDADYAFKMDPDTRLYRPFAYFPTADVFGSREWNGMIQGGIQGFAKAAVAKIINSGVTLDPAYADVMTWARDQGAYDYATTTGTISTDYSLFHICDALNLSIADWGEVHSVWLPQRLRAGVAASHPHKWEGE